MKIQIPDDHQLRHLVIDECHAWEKKTENESIEICKRVLNHLIDNLHGLTLDDAKRLIHSAIYTDEVLKKANDDQINEARYELMNHNGLISFEYDVADPKEVAGLSQLKYWLSPTGNQQKASIQPMSYFDPIHMTLPEKSGETKLPEKGILLFGVKGSGKSLAARATAGIWEVPLLRLNMEALLSTDCNQTAKDLERVIKLVEKLAPCVLWFDEIERAICLHNPADPHPHLDFLKAWVLSHPSQVFVVATSNHVDRIPEAWLDRALFKEHFFIDLPQQTTREDVFKMHLKQRGHNPDSFDISRLAYAAEEFSGAEIEQAIVTGICHTKAQGRALSNHALMEEVHRITPAAIMAEEEMMALRQWARGRTLPAN